MAIYNFYKVDVNRSLLMPHIYLLSENPIIVLKDFSSEGTFNYQTNIN